MNLVPLIFSSLFVKSKQERLRGHNIVFYVFMSVFIISPKHYLFIKKGVDTNNRIKNARYDIWLNYICPNYICPKIHFPDGTFARSNKINSTKRSIFNKQTSI